MAILKRRLPRFRTDNCSNPLHETTMALLDRLKQELDRAGRVAQEAFDYGKTPLEAFRTEPESEVRFKSEIRTCCDLRASCEAGFVHRDRNSDLDRTSDSARNFGLTLTAQKPFPAILN